MFTFSLIRLPPDELEELEDLEEFISSSNLNPLFILGIDLSIFKDYLYKLPELREILSSKTVLTVFFFIMIP